MKKIICLFSCFLLITLSGCNYAPNDIKDFLEFITSDNLNITVTTTDLSNEEIIKIDGSIMYVYNHVLADATVTESYYVKDSSNTYRYYQLLGEWKKDIVVTSGIDIQGDYEDFVEDDFTLNTDGTYTLTNTLKVSSHGTMTITFETNQITIEKLTETIVFTNFTTTKITLPEIS